VGSEVEGSIEGAAAVIARVLPVSWPDRSASPEHAERSAATTRPHAISFVITEHYDGDADGSP
jgi:hypothetical protein